MESIPTQPAPSTSLTSPLPSTYSTFTNNESNVQPKKNQRRSKKPNYPPVQLGTLEGNTHKDFSNNYFATRKTNFLTFIPTVLYNEFRKLHNVYFLVIFIITLIPSVSPLLPWGKLAGLLFVLTVSGIREGVEEYIKWHEDRKVNRKVYQVVKPFTAGDVIVKACQDLRVGDIVLLKKDTMVPADMILLSSVQSDGICYVETSSLDGETNLKIKKAVSITTSMTLGHLSQLKALIQVEPPNHHLDNFEGNVAAEGEEKAPIGDENILLRGCFLKNVTWIAGVIVYCGGDTKLALNLNPPPSKLSQLDKRLNMIFALIILTQLVICSVFAILTHFWEQNDAESNWYVGRDSDSPSIVALRHFISYFALLSYVVPLSLVVILEVAKVVQAKYFMEGDPSLALDQSRVEKTGMKARTFSLTDDLGLVNYIFSDKTGTLTENNMQFRKCSINGILYENAGGGQLRQSLERSSTQIEGSSEHIVKFLEAVSLCHSVLASTEDSKEIAYKASSADEEALVLGAKVNGTTFLGEQNKVAKIDMMGKQIEFEHLCTIEFTYTRRRMSTLFRTPDGQVILYMKGADYVVVDRLAPGQEDQLNKLHQDLEYFSTDGLRTLVYAYKHLSEDQYQAFHSQFQIASNAIGNRTQLVEALAETIESQLTLMGCTAVEDRLQKDVPETIQFFRRAGIKIWVITGDKQETAINIGYSSKLLTRNMDLIIVNAKNEDDCLVQLNQQFLKYKDYKPHEDGEMMGKKPVGLVIDGHSLKWALHGHSDHFLQLACICRTVICNRVTPLQKARVVKIVKDKFQSAVTLAIGDGANDVSMIQEAHIGVGIFGKEGTQAVRSSDFGLRMFCHLKRLLVVHGRYAVVRNSGMVKWGLYKNLTVFLSQLWFGLLCAYSAQTSLDDYAINFFNVYIATAPQVFYGLFEKDLIEPIVEKHPEAYKALRLLPAKFVVFFILESIFHSAVSFCSSFLYFKQGVVFADGKSADLFLFGNIVFICSTFVVLFKIVMMTRFWNHLTIIGIVFSVLSVVITFLFESSLFQKQKGLFEKLWGLFSFYLLILIVLCLSFLPTLVHDYFVRTYYPTASQLLQEMYFQPEYKAQLVHFVDDHHDPNHESELSNISSHTSSASDLI